MYMAKSTLRFVRLVCSHPTHPIVRRPTARDEKIGESAPLSPPGDVICIVELSPRLGGLGFSGAVVRNPAAPSWVDTGGPSRIPYPFETKIVAALCDYPFFISAIEVPAPSYGPSSKTPALPPRWVFVWRLRAFASGFKFSADKGHLSAV